jgi:hypothetical protein
MKIRQTNHNFINITYRVIYYKLIIEFASPVGFTNRRGLPLKYAQIPTHLARTCSDHIDNMVTSI